MAVESIYADAFLKSVLLADGQLVGASGLNGASVYLNRGRQGGTYPMAVVSLYDTDDVNSGNAVRLFSRYLYRARVVGKVIGTVLQDAAKVRFSAHRMDAVLNGIRRQQMTFEDGTTLNFNVWRERELPPPREEPGESADVFYRNVGGLYRVEAFT